MMNSRVTTDYSRQHRRRRRAFLAGLALAGVTLGVLSFSQPPSLVWNSSASLPIGIYRLVDAPPQTGDIVAIRPEPSLQEALAQAKALRRGQLLLKPLVAQAGDYVCRTGAVVAVNQRPVALTRPNTLPFPPWRDCRRLMGHEVFLIAPHPQSLDSRYFGPVSRAGIVGLARPVLTFNVTPPRAAQ